MKHSNIHTSLLKDLAKPWLNPIISLVLLIILGAIGYRITEGWDWGDCLWMVLITISTIGFGEVEPLSALGRVVTILIVGGGLIVIQLTIQKLIRLIESGYFVKTKELRFNRILRSMQEHVIICGYGRTGKEIAEQLNKESIPTLIVELDQNRKLEADKKDLKVLLADATLDETLIKAGIDKCRSLVATLPTDASNLYVVLSAKGLNPQCRLIARAETEESANKLRLAGATAVVSPYVAAGRTMAATALRPIAVDFIDLLAGSECEIEEFFLSADISKFDKIKNNTISDLEIGRQSGAMIIAIRDNDKLISNPSREEKVLPGQVLIALGSKDELKSLRLLLKDIVLP